MNDIEKYKEKTFESTQHMDEFGNKYWKDRELMPLLEYVNGRIFIMSLKER